MPTYEYSCTSCGEQLEVVQSFQDDPLTTCPACGGALRKVYGNIGVVFKGTGFYKTDSRAAKHTTQKASDASDKSAASEAPGREKAEKAAPAVSAPAPEQASPAPAKPAANGNSTPA